MVALRLIDQFFLDMVALVRGEHPTLPGTNRF